MKPNLIVAAVLMVAATAAGAASRFDGTWRYDLGSLDAPKKPNVYLLAGGSYTCSTCIPAYTIPADGAFHATPGNPYRDELSVKVVDARTVTLTGRKAGKVVTEMTETVAPDDATATATFNDMTATNGVAVTGTSVTRRVAPAPAGAHKVSGSWLDTATGTLADAGQLVTLKMDGETLAMTTPTGVAYTAVVGGPEAPVTGDPGWTTVSLTRTGPDTLIENDYRDGKLTGVFTYALAADGRSMRTTFDDRLHGTTSAVTFVKQ